MPAINLSDRAIANFIPTDRQTNFYDSGKGSARGLFLKLSPGGGRSFWLNYRDKQKRGSRQVRLGPYPALTLAKAREKARELVVALQLDPDHFRKQKIEQEDSSFRTFQIVAEDFKKRHIDRKGLRTGRVMWQQIEKHLIPEFGPRDIRTIKRSEIARHLDKIEDRHGPSMCDSVLAILRSICKFHTSRDDDFASPIVSGMKRGENNSRSRVLNDDEIRVFWSVTGTMGIFGGLLRVCLLTGQRRTKVNLMKHTDISPQDGIWTLGREKREKFNADRIKLAPLALAIIADMPRINLNPYVFPGTRLRGPFSGWGQSIEQLHKLMKKALPEMEHWVVHDLRRTFRTRCSMLKIDREVAERCLGHRMGNAVEQTYSRYGFDSEMADAFQRIADHVAEIVNPTPSGSNVVKLSARRSKAPRQAPPDRPPTAS